MMGLRSIKVGLKNGSMRLSSRSLVSAAWLQATMSVDGDDASARPVLDRADRSTGVVKGVPATLEVSSSAGVFAKRRRDARRRASIERLTVTR